MKLLYKIFIVLLCLSQASLIITKGEVEQPNAGDIIIDERTGKETIYQPETVGVSTISEKQLDLGPSTQQTTVAITVAPTQPAVPDLQKGGKPDYIPVNMIRPGQVQYSKKNRDIKLGDIARDKKNKSEEVISKDGKKTIKITALYYHNGTSAFDLKGAAPAMKIIDQDGKVKYMLADKHHDTLADIEAGEQAGIPYENITMPINVVDDFTNMSYPEFLKYAKNNYLIDLLIPIKNGGYASDLPHTFAEMQNNPVRYFVTMSAIKFFNGELPDTAIGLMDLPLWIKRLGSFNKKQPQDKANERMLENVIAQKLIDNGFVYDDNVDVDYTIQDPATGKIDDKRYTSGKAFQDYVQQAHAILTAPKNAQWARSIGLRLIPKLGSFYDPKFKQKLIEIANRPDQSLVKKNIGFYESLSQPKNPPKQSTKKGSTQVVK